MIYPDIIENLPVERKIQLIDVVANPVLKEVIWAHVQRLKAELCNLPYGGDPKEFQLTYRQLKESLDQMEMLHNNLQRWAKTLIQIQEE